MRLQSKRVIFIFYEKRLFWVALIWCVLCIFSAKAQYRFDSWTTDNGLPQVSINSIHQTRDGYLWLTTFGSLVRYDGLRFQVFNTGNTKGLKTGRFTETFEDKTGNFWIATEKQGITRYKNGVFSTYAVNDGLPDNAVEKIRSDQGGNLILESDGQLFQWNGEKFVPYTSSGGEPLKNILQTTKDGGIWFFEDGHLRKYENGKVVFDLAAAAPVLRVYEDSRKRIWFAESGKNALLSIENGKIIEHTLNDGYPAFRFSAVLEDSRKDLWFGTANGLVRLKDGKFSRFTTAEGLIHNNIRYIYEDREGTIWVGTDGGLTQLSISALKAYSSENGLAADNIYPIYQDRSGRIWVGSWAGLSLYEKGVFKNVGAQFGVDGANVTALYEDRQGVFWIGTWNGDVRKIKDGQVTNFPIGKIASATIRVIYQDRADNIWFGTSGGLIKVKDGVITEFTAKNGLSSKEIFAIYEDAAENLWLGTESGLTKFKDGVFTDFTEKDGIGRNTVRTIYEDAAGTFWIGTYDSGLYRLKNNSFTHYTTNNGLFDNGVFQIIEDGKENLWISCNLGIYRVRKSELNDFAEKLTPTITSVPYNRRDGMLNSECNGGFQPAGIKTFDNQIWFPTQKGVAVIDPEAIPFNSAPPPIAIQALIVDSKPTELSSSVNLKPGETNLEIQYSGLSFINPELVKFKYKLEGLDADWIDAGTRRSAYYSHLPPGKYRFLVSAANRDNVWNEQGASIEINVLPAYWQTWWFWFLVGICVCAVIWAFYRWRFSFLQRESLARETFARQLIESQEDERRRIAVELHDSLGQSLVLIKNWALLGIKAYEQRKDAKNNLPEIVEAASGAINEVREIAYNLGPYQLERLGLKKSIEEMIEKIARSSAIEFSVEIDDFDGYFPKQSQISIFRIIQEAVSNVVKHSNAAHAEISARILEDEIYLKISDDGEGFIQEVSNDAKGKYGFGLLGMSERVRLLEGDYEIKSEPGKGTIILVILQYEQSCG